MDKKIERLNADKVLRRLTNQIRPLGFVRTKPTFWVRENERLIHFIHIHKFTFGPHFRIHTCVRPLNSNREFVALIGPSDRDLDAEAKFEYADSLDTVESCASNMASFISVHSEEWYKNFGTVETLLGENSVLDEEDKNALQESMNSHSKSSNAERSRLSLKIA